MRDKSAEILREVGYDDATIARVGDLNLKKQFGQDPDCQILEDALCLVTLQYQLSDLVAKTEPGQNDWHSAEDLEKDVEASS